MPGIQNILGLCWLGGDSKYHEKKKKCWKEHDPAKESLILHKSARAMGLESDSEDENFNTNRPRKYREKGKYDPPMDLSTPLSSPFAKLRDKTNKATATSDPSLESRSGTTISYSATDGYQREIWKDRVAQESGQENTFGQASPRVAALLRNSEYPSADLGRIGDPWGEQPLTDSTSGTYITPHRRSRDSRPDHPRSSDKIPVESSSLAETRRSSDKIPVESLSPVYYPRDRTSSNGAAGAYQGNNRRSTDQQGSSHDHQPPPTPRLVFDPVRDAAARNLAGPSSRANANFTPLSTSYAIASRHSILSAALTPAPKKGKSRDTTKTTNEAKQTKIRHQKEDQEGRKRRDRNLQQSQQASQQRPAFSSSQPSAPIGIPLLPAPSTTPFQPNNSWPGNINSPPYPLSRPITRPHRSSLRIPFNIQHNTFTTDSTTYATPTTNTAPYPTTPPTYRLNAWNPQNSIQKRAIHHAFRDTLLNGHTCMAGPTPPTFRSDFVGAAELDGGDFMTANGIPRNETSGNETSGNETSGNETPGNQRIAMPAGRERIRGINFDSRQFPVQERGDRGEVQAGDGDTGIRGGVPEIRAQSSTGEDVEGEGEEELQVLGRERRRHGHRHGHGHGHRRRKSGDGHGAREHRKKQ
ncbi:hypothetical protein EYC80_002860 [Monilinia laxa]|uniref:Uncharacterized protein n=1 Tax=Monilinia laxa TaxID=61186 RepID=A0A5N6KC39_MONLA|nr:hypothetical protein EYC80_002860 [Monilinia laxa]